MYKVLTDEIIKSLDNTAGTLLNSKAINIVVIILIKLRNLDKDYIDNLIHKYESESGYLVQSNDFIYVLKPYLIGE